MLPEGHDPRPRHDTRDGNLPHLRGAVDDLRQVLEGRELHAQLEEEPVELRLRQRIRPLHLDRILGGQDEEGQGQRVGRPRDGDRAFLHAFEQRGLCLGRGPVDLIGEKDVGEDRAPLELEVLPARLVLDNHVGAYDVAGHEVGRELYAREGQIETLGQGLDEESLAETGDAFEEHVSAGEEAGKHVVDHVVMADDDLADLAAERLESGDELLDPLFLTRGWRGRLRHSQLLSHLR